MHMEVPHILIAGRPVVLARGDALALENVLHGPRQVPRGAKEIGTETVRNIQHVLAVRPGNHQVVALDSRIVVRRYEGKHVLIDQHYG